MASFLRPAAGWPALVVLAAWGAGCGQPAPPPTAAKIELPPVSDEPGQVELYDVKATRDKPDLVNFEVKYKFTKGKPDKYYLVEIRFPGTNNLGNKPMEHWQLKPEGVIKDGVTLRQPEGVKTVEIVMSETVNPMAGYTKNSNVATGEVK